MQSKVLKNFKIGREINQRCSLLDRDRIRVILFASLSDDAYWEENKWLIVTLWKNSLAFQAPIALPSPPTVSQPHAILAKNAILSGNEGDLTFASWTHILLGAQISKELLLDCPLWGDVYLSLFCSSGYFLVRQHSVLMSPWKTRQYARWHGFISAT